MVFEGQPDDFCHLKSDLENLFFSKTLEKQYFFRHFPFVTALLILTNVLVFIYVDANGSTENSFNMLRSGAAYWKYIFEDGEYSRLFTCIFLHFDAEHLLNNMITLGFIGTASERKFGHIGFSFIYFVSGLFASLASAFYYMNHDTGIIVISAGASGAIFGILGALVVYLIFTRNIRQNLSPAYLLIIMLLSVSNVFSDPAVDNIGHMGGIVCGIILGFISCFCRRKRLK
jgi:rhomboid protease GluP